MSGEVQSWAVAMRSVSTFGDQSCGGHRGQNSSSLVEVGSSRI